MIEGLWSALKETRVSDLDEDALAGLASMAGVRLLPESIKGLSKLLQLVEPSRTVNQALFEGDLVRVIVDLHSPKPAHNDAPALFATCRCPFCGFLNSAVDRDEEPTPVGRLLSAKRLLKKDALVALGDEINADPVTALLKGAQKVVTQKPLALKPIVRCGQCSNLFRNSKCN